MGAKTRREERGSEGGRKFVPLCKGADPRKPKKIQNHMNKISFGMLLVLAVGALSGGCVVALRETPQRPTVGMELLDLQKAKESGALSGAEYEKKRAALLKRD